MNPKSKILIWRVDTKAQVEKEVVAKFNCKIRDESAKILIELKWRAIVTSNTDAIIQGLFALHEKIIQRDLALAKLQSSASD